MEHWRACHKEHCKKLVAAKEVWREGDVPVCLGSNHPFPANGVPADTTEALLLLVMRVLRQMQHTGHPACSTKAALLEQIWERIAGELSWNYTTRKIFPPSFCFSSTVKIYQELFQQTSEIFFSETEDELGLWSTLNLLLINLLYHMFLQDFNSPLCC